MIESIYPYCNKETSNLRNKLDKLFLKTEELINKHDNYDKKLEICYSYFQKEILDDEG